jgi:hypothetical protein
MQTVAYRYGSLQRMTAPNAEIRTKRQPAELLSDPHIVTVSITEAAEILGVARSTAHAHYKRTGELVPSVPVLRVGKRCVVSLAHLRAALGLPKLSPN